jgi:hypothetical protein
MGVIPVIRIEGCERTDDRDHHVDAGYGGAQRVVPRDGLRDPIDLVANRRTFELPTRSARARNVQRHPGVSSKKGLVSITEASDSRAHKLLVKAA